MKILDVGCSKNKVNGAVGLDMDPTSDADILCDLTKRLPIEDSEYDLIYCKHLLEHLEKPEDVVHLIKEIYRVGKPGSRVIFEVPHFSNYVAYSDITHRRYFSYFLLENLMKLIPHKTIVKEIKFYKTFRAVESRHWLTDLLKVTKGSGRLFFQPRPYGLRLLWKRNEIDFSLKN